jgi:hypothetical protein
VPNSADLQFGIVVLLVPEEHTRLYSMVSKATFSPFGED